MLLPGTACDYQTNFAAVLERLGEKYHLICVNYDGFDGSDTVFPDMITVTEKIENYIKKEHGGRADRPDAILHDFAGIAGTMAADAVKVPNIMLYTSYPSNESYSVSASFTGVPADHPLRIAADRIAEGYAEKYGCRKMTVKEICDGQGDLNLVMVQKRLVPNSESFDDSFVFTGVQIEKKGLGLAFPDKKAITGEALRAAILRLLEEPSFRETARDFSEDMRAIGGAQATADAIERFLEK